MQAGQSRASGYRWLQCLLIQSKPQPGPEVTLEFQLGSGCAGEPHVWPGSSTLPGGPMGVKWLPFVPVRYSVKHTVCTGLHSGPWLHKAQVNRDEGLPRVRLWGGCLTGREGGEEEEDRKPGEGSWGELGSQHPVDALHTWPASDQSHFRKGRAL